jgi:hypothetical protein
MRLKIKEIITILQKEIDWCSKHPNTSLSKDEQKGFINGLRQAQYLIKAFESKVAKNA